MLEIIGGIVIFSVLVLLSGVKTVKEHDQLVVFRSGKILGSRGAGMHLIVPFIDRGQLVDTRPTTYTVESVRTVTNDNCHLTVSTLLVAQVTDAARAISKVSDYQKAIVDTAQAVLSEAIQRQSARDIVHERKRVNHRVKSELEKRTRPWGMRIRSVEIKEVILSEEWQSKVNPQLAQEPESTHGSSNGHGNGNPSLPIMTIGHANLLENIESIIGTHPYELSSTSYATEQEAQ